MIRSILLLMILMGSAVCQNADAALPWTTEPGQLTADYWVDRTPDAEALLLDRQSIAVMNTRVLTEDPSMQSLDRIPEALPGDQLRTRIQQLGHLPDERFDVEGRQLSQRARRKLQRTLALDRLPASVEPRWALVTERSSLRSLPTRQRLTNRPGDHDLDRLQESTLFPGDAVAVVHTSRDRNWHFVISERYAAWIAASSLAFAEREIVVNFQRQEPAVVIHAAEARTVFDPASQRSDVIDMGVRLPWQKDWPLDAAVSGQLPLAHYVVTWPSRDRQGQLMLKPRLIPVTEPAGHEPLPYRRSTLLRQGFRFLGERYGWGHDFEGRDCSGFVSEVFRSVGIQLPRNTGDQALSRTFQRQELPASWHRSRRLEHLRSRSAGDLLYLPGHVMMLIGFVDGEPWVLHDAHTIRVAETGGTLRSLPLNGVVVTPLTPLLAETGEALIDRLTASQRILPAP
ncbi:MAG: SH3 domain-containing protein [Ahniella sp.]|nr:SH3 domain-containing protein [Ahniella sp.]